MSKQKAGGRRRASSEVWVTYCSREKKADSHPLSAYERYDSERIKVVYRTVVKSKRSHLFFLSAKYGLLRYDEPIRWYDKLLRLEEVGQFCHLVSQQLYELDVKQVNYCTKRVDEKIFPYIAAIAAGCALGGADLRVFEYQASGVFLKMPQPYFPRSV
jgi:hypothetical protein